MCILIGTVVNVLSVRHSSKILPNPPQNITDSGMKADCMKTYEILIIL